MKLWKSIWICYIWTNTSLKFIYNMIISIKLPFISTLSGHVLTTMFSFFFFPSGVQYLLWLTFDVKVHYHRHEHKETRLIYILIEKYYLILKMTSFSKYNNERVWLTQIHAEKWFPLYIKDNSILKVQTRDLRSRLKKDLPSHHNLYLKVQLPGRLLAVLRISYYSYLWSTTLIS